MVRPALRQDEVEPAIPLLGWRTVDLFRCDGEACLAFTGQPVEAAPPDTVALQPAVRCKARQCGTDDPATDPHSGEDVEEGPYCKGAPTWNNGVAKHSDHDGPRAGWPAPKMLQYRGEW